VTDQTSLQQAKDEVATFKAIVAKVNAGLTAQGLQDQVAYQVDERGLTIKLVGAQTFFEPDRAELLPAALATVETIGPALLGLPNEISIEGHAASDPKAPTDWELAGARSTAVLRHLVEVDGIDATKIAAVSYGSARPVPGDYALSRRVDIVIFSNLSDAAKALVPQVVATTSG
jgi:chemotaxis protein MotB